MTLHKITEFYAEWYSTCPNITSKFRTIFIFKSAIKEISDLNKGCMSMIIYFTKLHLCKYNGSWVVSIKQNVNFNFQPSRHVHIFGSSQK
jgi:hypothetical protein